ncbi:MAG: hypothetical protein IID32_04360 [Planctomycetes bacterium]|nr:hypothetical protein [Planctomycetota bacterium]
MEEIAGLKIHTVDIPNVKLAEGIDEVDFEGFCRMVGLMDPTQFYAFLERFEIDYLEGALSSEPLQTTVKET